MASGHTQADDSSLVLATAVCVIRAKRCRVVISVSTRARDKGCGFTVQRAACWCPEICRSLDICPGYGFLQSSQRPGIRINPVDYRELLQQLIMPLP